MMIQTTVLQVRALDEMERPEPVRSLKDSVFTMRLVVEAMAKEEYEVEEEKVEVRRGRVEMLVVEVARMLPTVSWVPVA